MSTGVRTPGSGPTEPAARRRRGWWAAYGPSVLLGAGATLSGVALTATSGWLVVRASERPVILTLLTAIVAVRTFGLARPLLRYAERLRSHDRALHALARAREDVARRLVPLTPARLGRRGDLLTGVVDDVTDVTEAAVRAGVPAAGAALTVVVTAGLTALVAPTVALVHLGLLAAVVLVVRLALGVERRGQAQLEQARAQVQRVAGLVTVHRRDLLGIGAGADAQRWLDEAQGQWDAAARAQSRGRALTQAATPVLVGVATAVSAVVVAGLVASRATSPALGALLVLTPVALAEALAPLADAVRAQARAESAGRRLTHLLGATPAVSPTRCTPPAAVPDGPVGLELVGAGAAWAAGGGPDLAPVDLRLPPGSRSLVTGANGTGKSTLLAVLARHLDPSVGSYVVTGAAPSAAAPDTGAVDTGAVDVRDLPLDAVRSRVAVVGDEPWVLATSLRENLRVARPQPDPLSGADLDERLVQGLTRAGLGAWWAGLPDGLDTRLGVGGRGVSGGERARLALARALVSERQVLLLDEPVAHLDPDTARAVLTDLALATAGRTVVLVSHDAVPEGLVDRVITLGGAVPRSRIG
ncbi:ATP-binding cassette domain-containing protein [Dermatophilaceae bacterium Soc4.6]